jgi:hypothetical protein
MKAQEEEGHLHPLQKRGRQREMTRREATGMKKGETTIRKRGIAAVDHPLLIDPAHYPLKGPIEQIKGALERTESTVGDLIIN